MANFNHKNAILKYWLGVSTKRNSQRKLLQGADDHDLLKPADILAIHRVPGNRDGGPVL